MAKDQLNYYLTKKKGILILTIFALFSCTTYANVLTNLQKDHYPKGEIALSLDDAPTPSTKFLTGVERTKKIVNGLRETNCPPIGIFALTSNLVNKAGKVNLTAIERLKSYAAAGHMIANHSHSHFHLSKVSEVTFIEDIKKAHNLLCNLPNFYPFFRFPYLDRGTIYKQQQVLKCLEDLNYKEGYVTVCNYDYRLNELFLKAIRSGKNVNYAKLKNIYISILLEHITQSQKKAQALLEKNVKHVLLLHENDIAALFIKDLVEELRLNGWKIISIQEAYQETLEERDLSYILERQLHLAEKETKDKLKTLLTEQELKIIQYSYIEKILREKQVFTDPVKSSTN